MSTLRQIFHATAATSRLRPSSLRRRNNLVSRPREHEAVPAAPLGPGVLHLRLPAPHTAAKISRWLELQRQPCSGNADCLSIAVNDSDPASFIASLGSVLTAPELAATRALFQPLGMEFTLQDYFQMQSLHGLLARQDAAWLMGLLSRQALSMHFQPIVSANAERQLFAYECLMRGREEAGAEARLVPPSRMLEIARKAELTDRLDRAARQAALRATAHHGIQAKVFVNFTATAIYDPLECLEHTLALIAELGLSRQQFVFEAVESDEEEDIGHLRALLECFRKAGFEVALDDLSSGYASLQRLERLTPDYIKLDIEIISGVDRDPYKALIAAKLLATAQALGVKTVAEGVETAAEFAWAAAQGADYVQGFYVAQPGNPPPQSPWAMA